MPQGSIKETLSRVDPLDVWRVLKSAGVKYVKPIIIDIHGRPRAELMPIDAAKDILTDGMPFDGSSIQSYATVNKSDFVALPDFRSMFIESWNSSKIVDVFLSVLDDSGKPNMLDPRNVLMQTLDELAARNLYAKVGVEIEFFIVKLNGGKPELADDGLYFEGRNAAMLVNPITKILENLEALGIGWSKTHHEVAPSQYEINIPANDPLKVADMIVVYKLMAKDVANEFGLVSTFMPKPFWGINGSGAHTHFSLWRDGVNLFESKTDEVTEECRYSIGGILKFAKAISVVVAPTVNSYKRLVPHHEAPTRIVWGYANRSAMVRVPYYGKRVNRIEYRHPDPSMNPYLAFTVMVKAAVYGMDNKVEPPAPVSDVAYELKGVPETPATLGEAVEEFTRSEAFKFLPGEMAKAYAEVKSQEWSEYSSVYNWKETWNVITPWEIERYLKAA